MTRSITRVAAKVKPGAHSAVVKARTARTRKGTRSAAV
jgi:hypothetical protein